MPPDTARVVETAMALRGTAPELWRDFVAAVQDYGAQVNGEMVRCSPDMLARAQGMAIQATEFSSVLEQAPKIHEKYLQFKQGKQNVRPSNP